MTFINSTHPFQGIKSNIVIISNALQLINAIEAVHHFGCKNNILIIVHNSRGSGIRNSVQMDCLIKYHNWNSVVKIDMGQRRNRFWLSYIKVVKMLKTRDYEYIFLGGIDKFFYSIVQFIKKNKLVYLDEGTSTFYRYYHFFAQDKKVELGLKYRFFWLFGFRVQPINNNYTLFTYFNLEPLSHLSIEHNNLTWFKKKYFSNSKKDDNLYYLGSCGVDKDSESNYDNMLSQFIKSQDKKVTYIPHRNEKIRKNLLVMFDEYGVKVLRPNMPIEIYFLVNKIIPGAIAGTESAAFFTLLLLCPGTHFQATYLKLNKRYALFEKETYEQLSQAGVEIVDYNNNVV